MFVQLLMQAVQLLSLQLASLDLQKRISSTWDSNSSLLIWLGSERTKVITIQTVAECSSLNLAFLLRTEYEEAEKRRRAGLLGDDRCEVESITKSLTRRLHRLVRH